MVLVRKVAARRFAWNLQGKASVIRRANEVSALMLRIDELLISKEIPKFHKK